MKKSALLSLLIFLCIHSFGKEMIFDRLDSLFEQQLKAFPQEKIYLHTDKPYYISGEPIWFRAYLVDAAAHVPVFASRYIYVELINPLDTVVVRVKIQQTDSIYSGRIDIPPDVPEGDYTLRAYTNFMQSVDENYWFTKNIHIGDPQNRDIHVKTAQGSYHHSTSIPDDDFDVAFYPEGGVLLEDTLVEVTFKALKSNGKSSDITGVVYDNQDDTISQIKTDYAGMGVFGLYSEKGKTYYAVCSNEKGKSKRFDLPAVYNDRYDLCVNQRNDNLYISVLKPAAMTQQDTLYLLAHTRGVAYYADRIPNGKTSVIIPNDLFPSGVLQVLLLDARLQPLSERLVFIHNDDQAKVDFRTDKENYAKRSLVQADVTVTDRNHKLLAGNFSVSVTDDNEVITDACNNILSSLLLTSDLKGHIECPASYFSNSAASSNRLDLLMLTQGWRRYDVPALIGGILSHPAAALEIGAQISGTVKNILSGKPASGIDVSIFSPNQKYFDKTKTDKKGRFYFINCDLPDSTLFIVQADTKRGLRRMEIDRDSFPDRTLPAAPQEAIDRNVFAQYVDKAEQKYTYEHGMREIFLKEVTVTAAAKRNPEYSSEYYDNPDYSITEEDIDRSHPNTTEDIFNLLRRIPGVRIINERIVIISHPGSLLHQSPIIFIDGWPGSFNEIIPQNIIQIDILKNASILGMKGANGAIFIYTRIGTVRSLSEQELPNVKFITPSGYQKPVEFYSPKYDTPEARENNEPDLRTTVYWKPNIEIDDKGNATFDFYTADSETTYTVILEGITSDGKIIYKEEKINRNAR